MKEAMDKTTFKDLVVIVTGASSGIGREVARQLAAQGACLALAARRTDQLESAAADCRSLGAKVMTFAMDVSDANLCKELVERTVKEYGKIDMLVNNAGITMWVKLEDVQDISIYEKIIRINYLGSVYCTYYALPYLKQTGGRIVGISSLAGKNGVPTRSGYAASKHALAGFYDSLRIELSGSGVSVTTVYPGFVATGAQARAFGADGKPIGGTPIRDAEVMQPPECAAIILQAAAQRKRDEVMTLRGKLGIWLKLIAPGLVDRIARQAIQKGR
jgi:short-subunit dehydrogenase